MMMMMMMIFFLQVLPILVFLSTVISILYYIGFMSWLICKVCNWETKMHEQREMFHAKSMISNHLFLKHCYYKKCRKE